MQSPIWIYISLSWKIAADRTFFFLFMLESMGVDSFISGVPSELVMQPLALHHVIVQIWICGCRDFESFIATSSCHENQNYEKEDQGDRPAIIALVDAIAGMIFLTTPWVKE
jgi:hypothetical protein